MEAFNDKRFIAVPRSYRRLGKDGGKSSWRSLTEAGRLLRFRFVEPPSGRRGGWVLDPVREQLMKEEEGCGLPNETRKALKELIRTSQWFLLPQKITEANINEFKDSMKNAILEFELYEDLLALIMHDRSIRFGPLFKALPKKYKSIGKNRIHYLAAGLIARVRHWQRMTDLYYKYLLYLPECDFLTDTTRFSDAFEKLMEYVDPKYKALRRHKLYDGLNYYHGYQYGAARGWLQDDYRTLIDMDRKREEVMFNERLHRFPACFVTPFHFLAYKVIWEGYETQEPALEILKLRAYFDEIVVGIAEIVRVSRDCGRL